MKTIDYICPSLTVFTMVTENTIMTGSVTDSSVVPSVDVLERDGGSLDF